jgi:hypothetical protein
LALRLFKALNECPGASKPTQTEHSYDPCRRFRALSRSLRQPRGSKSSDHLTALRRSDPLIHLWAWHDWASLHESVRTSNAARVHQQALIRRAMQAHKQACAEKASHARPATVEVQRTGERSSADTVFALLDEMEQGLLFSPSEPTSPVPTKLGIETHDAMGKRDAPPREGERSPGSVLQSLDEPPRPYGFSLA